MPARFIDASKFRIGLVEGMTGSQGMPIAAQRLDYAYLEFKLTEITCVLRSQTNNRQLFTCIPTCIVNSKSPIAPIAKPYGSGRISRQITIALCYRPDRLAVINNLIRWVIAAAEKASLPKGVVSDALPFQLIPKSRD